MFLSTNMTVLEGSDVLRFRPSLMASFLIVTHEPKVIGILAPTSARLERDVAQALRDVAPERIITISYAVSRIFGFALQHHALIVLRGD